VIWFGQTLWPDHGLPDHMKTSINIYGCVFHQKGTMQLLTNTVDNKEIYLHTSSNLELNDNFSAWVSPGKGKVVIVSDLTG
jgi:hypothetical protein